MTAAIRSDQPAWLRGAETASIVFSVLAIANSAALVVLHLRRNRHAVLRKATIRILLMVPLFTLTATASLWLYRFGWARDVLVVLRDLYESVVIFSFLELVITCCGGVAYLLTRFEIPADRQDSGDLSERGLAQESGAPAPASAAAPEPAAQASEIGEVERDAPDVEAGQSRESRPDEQATCGPDGCCEGAAAEVSPKTRPVKQLPLMERCLPPWRSAEQMLRWCITGVLLQVVISILYSVFKAVVFLMQGLGGVPETQGIVTASWAAAIILSLSQGVAVSALLVLAVNMMEDLKPIRPKAKFLSVKAVVFFTFWQAIIWQLLGETHSLDGWSAWCGFGGKCYSDGQSVREVQTVLQNLCICFEMCVMSFAHLWVFPPEDYLTILAHQHIFRHEARAKRRLNTPNPLQPSGAIINLTDIFLASRCLQSEAKEHRRSRPHRSVVCCGADEEEPASRDGASG